MYICMRMLVRVPNLPLTLLPKISTEARLQGVGIQDAEVMFGGGHLGAAR